jgi:hypothetical protein
LPPWGWQLVLEIFGVFPDLPDSMVVSAVCKLVSGYVVGSFSGIHGGNMFVAVVNDNFNWRTV